MMRRTSVRTGMWGVVIGVTGLATAALAQPVPGPDAPKAPAATGQSDPLPSASSIFDRYIQVIGGQAAMDKITNRVMEGRVSNSLGTLNATVTIEQAPPNKLHSSIEIPGFGMQESGYDGTTAWLMDPNTGASILSGRDLENFKDNAAFWGEGDYKNRYKKTEVLERTTFEERPAFKVRAVGQNDQDRTLYFDTETGLFLGAVFSREVGNKQVESTLAVSDYRETNGTKWPAKVVQRSGKEDATFTFDKLATNVSPAPSFELPSEVKKVSKPK
jgi:hypothetical protein